jgi:hypothetical protein
MAGPASRAPPLTGDVGNERNERAERTAHGIERLIGARRFAVPGESSARR